MRRLFGANKRLRLRPSFEKRTAGQFAETLLSAFPAGKDCWIRTLWVGTWHSRDSLVLRATRHLKDNYRSHLYTDVSAGISDSVSSPPTLFSCCTTCAFFGYATADELRSMAHDRNKARTDSNFNRQTGDELGLVCEGPKCDFHSQNAATCEQCGFHFRLIKGAHASFHGGSLSNEDKSSPREE